MSTMLSTSKPPQSLKRERDEDNNPKTPLYTPGSTKITRADQDEGDGLETPLYVPDCESSNPFSTPPSRAQNPKRESSPLNTPPSKRASSPALSSTGSLSDIGTVTPSATRTSPLTSFPALDGAAEPPKKRAKLTFAEKEEQKILRTIKDQARAEERARKETEKKVKEEDKARKDAEREAERKKKEVEKEERRLIKEAERAEKEEKRLLKEAERAEKEKEKKAREDEKRRSKEEKQKNDEEKKKKEKSQPKLNAFFRKTGTAKDESPRKSPSPPPGNTLQSISTSMTKSPCKNNSQSEYQKRFPPFFVQKNVIVAPFTQFGRDESASSMLQNVIDTYVNGQGSPEKRPFDPVRLFNLPNYDVKPRGRRIIPVREIMPQILGHAKRPIDLTADSQNIQIKNTRKLLQTVPYKILSFAEDVRPPYKGTYTSQPKSGMRKLARNPMRRDLPNVNYDYDSEAEWEVEDGEDLESDCDEDEDNGDGGDDLEEFLDDTGAETLNARKLVMQGDLEPKCSGLCWENQKRRGPNAKLYRYLMEVISENDQIKTPIDPFATHYWDAPIPSGMMEPPRLPLNAIRSTNAGVNGPSCTNASFLNPLDHDKAGSQSCGAMKQPKKLVSIGDMPAFKQAVNGSDLSKVGLIEVLNKQFSKISKSTIKHTLETIAKRVGSKEAEKRWVVIE